jgi:hypothetical protein
MGFEQLWTCPVCNKATPFSNSKPISCFSSLISYSFNYVIVMDSLLNPLTAQLPLQQAECQVVTIDGPLYMGARTASPSVCSFPLTSTLPLQRL